MHQLAIQLYSIWVSVSKLLYRQLLANIKEKLMIQLRSLVLSSVFYTVLICVSLANCNLLQHSLILFCFILTEKRKKADKNLIKRYKYGSIKSPRCPALWFVYILMPGKDEWVLAQLSSQHKCVERPVRPVFPDYLSVSYDYEKT